MGRWYRPTVLRAVAARHLRSVTNSKKWGLPYGGKRACGPLAAKCPTVESHMLTAQDNSRLQSQVPISPSSYLHQG